MLASKGIAFFPLFHHMEALFYGLQKWNNFYLKSKYSPALKMLAFENQYILANNVGNRHAEHLIMIEYIKHFSSVLMWQLDEFQLPAHCTGSKLPILGFFLFFLLLVSPSPSSLPFPLWENTNGFDYIIAANFISPTSILTHHKQKSELQTPLRQMLVWIFGKPFMLVWLKKKVFVGKRNAFGVWLESMSWKSTVHPEEWQDPNSSQGKTEAWSPGSAQPLQDSFNPTGVLICEHQ